MAGLLTAAGHTIAARASDADELRAAVAALAAAGDLPDVVVTDVRMPPGNTDDGLRAALELRRAHPGLPVVVLSAYVASPYVRDLLDDGGAVGYLLKERVGRVADFLSSLEVVASGGIVVDPEVVATLLDGQDQPRKHTKHPDLRRLTDREYQVLGLIAEGLTNHQIARRLFLSDGAVAKHVAGVFTKLDLPPEEDNRRVRAVLIWLRATTAEPPLREP